MIADLQSRLTSTVRVEPATNPHNLNVRIWIDHQFDHSTAASVLLFSVDAETANLIIRGDLLLGPNSTLEWSETKNGHYSGEPYALPR